MFSVSDRDDPVDWNARIALARSILNQREPSEHTARMATAALTGATMGVLMALDQAGER